MSKYKRDPTTEVKEVREEEEDIEEEPNVGQIGVSHDAAKLACHGRDQKDSLEEPWQRQTN